MSIDDFITTTGVPVPGSRWRRVDDHAPTVVHAAAFPRVRLAGGAEMSILVFLRSFEPVVGGHWLDEAILRASVRAFTMVAPTASYPLTFATAWHGETAAERHAQLVASRGFFCGDCACTDLSVADVRQASEVIRMSQHGRCRCGAPTLWYHVADEARTRAAMRAYGAAA